MSPRHFLYQQLEAERPGRRGLSAINWVLLFLILFSLVLYTAETETQAGFPGTGIFQALDLLVLIVFGAEFVLRLYAIGSRPEYAGFDGLFRYVRHNWFVVAVDFLAFAPELIVLMLGLNPPSALRALRVARLFKLARYFPAFGLVAAALKSCIQELLAALAVSVMLWYIASVLLYLAEKDAQPEAFGSITRAMWWSVVTLTTIGYGDVYPITVPGKVLAGCFAVLGLGAVAMPSGILAGAFIESFRNRRRRPGGDATA